MNPFKKIGTKRSRFRLVFTVDEAIDIPSDSGEFFVLISRGKRGQETQSVFIENNRIVWNDTLTLDISLHTDKDTSKGFLSKKGKVHLKKVTSENDSVTVLSSPFDFAKLCSSDKQEDHMIQIKGEPNMGRVPRLYIRCKSADITNQALSENVTDSQSASKKQTQSTSAYSEQQGSASGVGTSKNAATEFNIVNARMTPDDMNAGSIDFVGDPTNPVFTAEPMDLSGHLLDGSTVNNQNAQNMSGRKSVSLSESSQGTRSNREIQVQSISFQSVPPSGYLDEQHSKRLSGSHRSSVHDDTRSQRSRKSVGETPVVVSLDFNAYSDEPAPKTIPNHNPLSAAEASEVITANPDLILPEVPKPVDKKASTEITNAPLDPTIPTDKIQIIENYQSQLRKLTKIVDKIQQHLRKRIPPGGDDGTGVGDPRTGSEQIIIGGAKFNGGDVNKYVSKVHDILGRSRGEELSHIEIMVACKLKIAFCKAELDLLQSHDT